jgi:hypothetical protein
MLEAVRNGEVTAWRAPPEHVWNVAESSLSQVEGRGKGDVGRGARGKAGYLEGFVLRITHEHKSFVLEQEGHGKEVINEVGKFSCFGIDLFRDICGEGNGCACRHDYAQHGQGPSSARSLKHHGCLGHN